MGNPGWRTQISFLLAGAIFMLCQMIMSSTRNAVDDPGVGQGDRSFQDSGQRGVGVSRLETIGRGTLLD
jgi:hypothetical protein